MVLIFMNTKLRKSLGRKIKKMRREIGITQEELAHEAGIERSYMGYIERGEKNPSLEKLHSIAKALKVSISQLVS